MAWTDLLQDSTKRLMDSAMQRPVARTDAFADTFGGTSAAYNRLGPSAQARILGNRTVEDQAQFAAARTNEMNTANAADADRFAGMQRAMGESLLGKAVPASVLGDATMQQERTRADADVNKAALEAAGRVQGAQATVMPDVFKMLFGDASASPFLSLGGGSALNTRTGQRSDAPENRAVPEQVMMNGQPVPGLIRFGNDIVRAPGMGLDGLDGKVPGATGATGPAAPAAAAQAPVMIGGKPYRKVEAGTPGALRSADGNFYVPAG